MLAQCRDHHPFSWGEVPCQHRNGEIVGYAVKYSSGQRQTEAVVDGQAITLDDLEPLTELQYNGCSCEQ